MSLAIERARSPWLAALAVLALVPILTFSYMGIKNLEVGSRPAEEVQAPVSIAAPGWAQRDWVTSVRRWSGGSRPGSADIAAATAAVTAVYDAMLLDPGSLDDAIGASFSPQAEAEIAGKQIGWPQGISDVRVKSRRLELGLQSGAADRAIAFIRISASGVAGDRPIELWHRGQFWMEKDGGGWTIFAFDIRQSPLP